MTKQQKTTLLLVAVLAIWGAIGYQIYSKLDTDEAIVITNSIVENYKPEKIEKRIAYTVNDDYRDPFLGTIKTEKKKVKKKSVPKSNPSIPFPNIIYNGVVTGGGTKSYVLTIQGKQELFKKGETIKKIKLLQANDEKIKVRFNGVTKSFELK
ncbi:hypothetical protein [Tenacibaculum sp. M341]|uniref:hypothetical protein n=1 Tax=Tenacibaculum sp. M341 TaxID=2530339 RepID=UPI001045BC10|nr:hypothetical protein [Tenacibaculum sp. M341]TCI85577.1 hypothetical protein EYW44_16595 [Tenacibaculum sp. M341]